jgi:acyl-CoA synthetase (NDP forming)
MVSQSGALGEAILADAAQAGLGVAMFASVGNRVDVTAADLVAYWGDDPQVKVILQVNGDLLASVFLELASA